MHFCKIGLKGIVFLVFGKESNLLSFGDSMSNVVFLDKVIEESPRYTEFRSKHLIEECFVLWNEETIVKKLISLVWFIFSESFQVVNLYVR